jgi:hypothetical protein
MNWITDEGARFEEDNFGRDGFTWMVVEIDAAHIKMELSRDNDPSPFSAW